MNFELVNSAACCNLPAILSRWLPDGKINGTEFIARNPRRADHQPGSFSINIRTGRWADFATGDRGGDPVSLGAYLFGLSQGEASRRIATMLGVTMESIR